MKIQGLTGYHGGIRLSVAMCLLAVGTAGSGAEPIARITVEAGTHTRTDTPVSVALEGMGQRTGGDLEMREVVGTAKVVRACQLEKSDPPRLWWVLAGTTPAGSTRTFELAAGPGKTLATVKVARTDKHLDILCKGAQVLRYHHAIVPPPAGKSKLYNRSGFIHPLKSPQGAVLTEIHPADHIHHVGI